NDGHTSSYTYCVWETFHNLLPAPAISLEVNGTQEVYIVAGVVDFISLCGTEYTGYYASIGFNSARPAGACVRVRSYRINGGNYSQRFGDLAGPVFPDLDNLTMELILANGTEPETVVIPNLPGYLGEPFTDAAL
ncbi:hypothetical protein EVJ58_g9487, partial [Rhodofomes roseus]